jgi:hypothetical protein
MVQPILPVYVSLYTIEKDKTSRLFLPILTWCQSQPATAASPIEPPATERRPREGEAVHGAGARTGATRRSQDGRGAAVLARRHWTVAGKGGREPSI